MSDGSSYCAMMVAGNIKQMYNMVNKRNVITSWIDSTLILVYAKVIINERKAKL